MAITDVSASLSITGHTSLQSAAAVTAALGLLPSKSYEFGDPHPSKSLAARGKITSVSYWRFDQPRTIKSSEDPHGIESLVRLTELFEPHSETLATLKTDYDIRVSMFGISDSGQAGLVIGPDTMQRLGKLSASFWQDIYLAEELTVDDIADWSDSQRRR